MTTSHQHINVDSKKKIAFICWFPEEYDWGRTIRIPGVFFKSVHYPASRLYNLLLDRLQQIKRYPNVDMFYSMFHKGKRRYNRAGFIPLQALPHTWNDLLKNKYTHIVLYNCKWFFVTHTTIELFIETLNNEYVDKIYSVRDDYAMFIDENNSVVKGKQIIPAVSAFPVGNPDTEYVTLDISTEEQFTVDAKHYLFRAALRDLYYTDDLRKSIVDNEQRLKRIRYEKFRKQGYEEALSGKDNFLHSKQE